MTIIDEYTVYNNQKYMIIRQLKIIEITSIQIKGKSKQIAQVGN